MHSKGFLLNRRIGMGGAVALGLAVFLVSPAAHAEGTTPASAPATGTIYFPSGIDTSQTRATGHVELDGTALHIWTEGATSTDKAAGYVATQTPLADVDSPSLDYTNTAGTQPGYQLVVDLNNDGTADGILVGENAYAGRWWLSNASSTFDWSGAPVDGTEYPHSAQLSAWTAAYPQAEVTAFGFSLGSGVKGDGILNAITFAGARYTFAADVVLDSKDACKNGGWATSTAPVYKNQGECVSHFATASNNGKGNGSGTGSAPTAGTGANAGSAPVAAAAASGKMRAA